jgi:hypothetical protein
MLLTINDSGKQLTQEDISALNKRLSLQIPDDYKVFLLKNNGGEPKEYAIKFNENQLEIGGEELGYFYGLETKTENILDALDNLQHFLPENLIPIADTPGGNLFLLSVNKDTYGNVFYKDHEIEDSFEFSDSNKKLPESMLLVANSFSDFLTKLYDPDE